MDDISAAFENVSIDDFLRETSASITTPLTPEECLTAKGRDNFNRFTNAHLESCVEAITHDEFTAYSVLHNPSERRYFKPDDDETAYHFAARLKREADSMHATWLFVAMVTPGRTYNSDEDDLLEAVDPDDKNQITDLIESGVLQMGVCWYSDSHEDEDRYRRSGMINLEDPSEQVEGDIEPQHNPFHHVLGEE